jgi:hypothetical protein
MCEVTPLLAWPLDLKLHWNGRLRCEAFKARC